MMRKFGILLPALGLGPAHSLDPLDASAARRILLTAFAVGFLFVPARSEAGRLVTHDFTSHALAGNRMGISNVRRITVQVPDAYDQEREAISRRLFHTGLSWRRDATSATGVSPGHSTNRVFLRRSLFSWIWMKALSS